MSMLTLTGVLFASAIAATALLATPTDRVAAKLTDPKSADGKIDWAQISLFNFEAETLDGERLPLSSLRGSVLLIVNVASQCGYTRQYADLQALHERYGKRGLVVIGVPSNEFGGQEPGSAEEIREFCTARFGVTFPLLAKAEVKPGEKQHPLFKALVTRTGEAPKWNFTKYLVARDGVRASAYASRVAPGSEEFIEVVERLLAEKAPASEESQKSAPSAESKGDPAE